MMKRLVRALTLRPRLGERGGVALVMVLSFMVLAVPLTTTGLRTAGQLQRASRVYDDRLHAMYNASSGIEAALYELLSDPAFDDDLTPSTPSKHVVVENNDETITVTITKIFSSETLQGQGIVVDKTVSTPYDPGVVPADTLTTYTFTIIVKNEGTGTVELVGIYDYLPPGMAYVPSSTSGLTAEEPNIGQIADATCGSTPDDLWWNLSGDDVSLADGQQLTLTFQAAGTLPDGVYYNQAQIRYDPWWTAPDQYIYTPYIAEVTVGAGGQKCGYEMEIAVSQAVTPETPSPGVPTEFTYTITVENVSASTRYVCKVEDLLPPTFTYDVLSAGDYPSNVRTVEPEGAAGDLRPLEPQVGRWPGQLPGVPGNHAGGHDVHPGLPRKRDPGIGDELLQRVRRGVGEVAQWWHPVQDQRQRDHVWRRRRVVRCRASSDIRYYGRSGGRGRPGPHHILRVRRSDRDPLLARVLARHGRPAQA